MFDLRNKICVVCTVQNLNLNVCNVSDIFTEGYCSLWCVVGCHSTEPNCFKGSRLCSMCYVVSSGTGYFVPPLNTIQAT